VCVRVRVRCACECVFLKDFLEQQQHQQDIKAE